MATFVVKGTLSVSRLCPQCAKQLFKDSDKPTICSCGYIWDDEPLSQISAGIQGKATV